MPHHKEEPPPAATREKPALCSTEDPHLEKKKGVTLLVAEGTDAKTSLCSLDPSSRKLYPCPFPQDAL